MKPFSQNTRALGVLIPLFGMAALLYCFATAVPAAAIDCQAAALNALGVANMTINSATDVPAAAPKPEYCDVKGSVATSGEGAGPNSAGFEAMLPANWNGKFIFNGVGGLAGNLTSSANLVDQALFLAKGYATAITDTGHVSTDPAWEITSPGEPNMPKVVDYFFRAVHEVTLATKALVKDYYHTFRFRFSPRSAPPSPNNVTLPMALLTASSRIRPNARSIPMLWFRRR